MTFRTVAILMLLGLVRSSFAFQDDPRERTTWFEHRGELRGVVLVVHGLNLRPSRMADITNSLQDGGMDVLRLTLTGHAGDVEEMRAISSDQWSRDAQTAYEAVARRAKSGRVPIFYVGFSIGGLLGEQLIAGGARFDRVALFAPAISLRAHAPLIKVFRIFGRRFLVPSLGVDGYRLYRSIPVVGYDALFDSLTALENANYRNANQPTLLIYDPADEVVDVQGIEKMIQEHGWSNWTTLKVSNQESRLSSTYHHLVIDRQAIGHVQWEKVSRALLDHFRR